MLPRRFRRRVREASRCARCGSSRSSAPRGDRCGAGTLKRMAADWTRGATTAEQAVASVRSGMRVFIHGAAATPTPLIDALARRADLENVTLYHLHTAGPAPFAAPEQEGRFFSVSLFTGSPLRDAVDEGRADFVPV